MTDFLVRTFIADYQQTDDQQVRTRYGRLSSIVGIVCNLLLFGAKIGAGILVNSISVIADAFNNLTDAASSIISFIGVQMAGKPADDEHPFGHGRIEYIAGFIVACLVIQVGLTFLKTSIEKILHPEEMGFSAVSVAVLLISVGLKLWMGLFNRKLGRRINSTLMLATSADSWGDAAVTSTTIFSMLVFGLFNVNIDGFIGLLVSGFILLAGINIARDTLEPLIGPAIDPKLYAEINNFVKSFDGIVGTHDLIMHNYGPSNSMASIHAEVPSDVDIQISHEIVDRIEREVLNRFRLTLVIHMDPVETKNQNVLAFKEMVSKVIGQLDPRLAFHDFRIVEGPSRINLIFDLVVPREYRYQEYEQLKAEISGRVQQIDTRCYCNITVENSYCAEE